MPKPIGGKRGDTYITAFDLHSTSSSAAIAGYSKALDIVQDYSAFDDNSSFSFIQIFNAKAATESDPYINNSNIEFSIDVSRINAIQWGDESDI